MIFTKKEKELETLPLNIFWQDIELEFEIKICANIYNEQRQNRETTEGIYLLYQEIKRKRKQSISENIRSGHH